jgi:phosphodiesterase/alkaline phosphatase D-like protein
MHRWHYSIPSNPPILVLDTRTQRDFGGYNDSPQLLNYAATEKLQADILRLQHKNAIKTAPLIISATPVMGHVTIELIKKSIYRIGLIFGKRFANSLDLESWFANKQGAARLLDILSKMKLPNNEVVFLSGDVHYSFVHKARYHTSDSSEILNCYQLTSSALRNAPKQRCCVSRLSKRILNGNQHTTHKKPKQPENLPWWERKLLWLLFKRSSWIVDIETIDGTDQHNKRIGRTTRSNIAILYLSEGKIQKQILLSGDQRKDNVYYDFTA